MAESLLFGIVNALHSSLNRVGSKRQHQIGWSESATMLTVPSQTGGREKYYARANGESTEAELPLRSQVQNFGRPNQGV